jgi:hypothetical protein
VRNRPTTRRSGKRGSVSSHHFACLGAEVTAFVCNIHRFSLPLAAVRRRRSRSRLGHSAKPLASGSRALGQFIWSRCNCHMSISMASSSSAMASEVRPRRSNSGISPAAAPYSHP